MQVYNVNIWLISLSHYDRVLQNTSFNYFNCRSRIFRSEQFPLQITYFQKWTRKASCVTTWGYCSRCILSMACAVWVGRKAGGGGWYPLSWYWLRGGVPPFLVLVRGLREGVPLLYDLTWVPLPIQKGPEENIGPLWRRRLLHNPSSGIT